MIEKKKKKKENDGHLFLGCQFQNKSTFFKILAILLFFDWRLWRKKGEKMLGIPDRNGMSKEDGDSKTKNPKRYKYKERLLHY